MPRVLLIAHHFPPIGGSIGREPWRPRFGSPNTATTCFCRPAGLIPACIGRRATSRGPAPSATSRSIAFPDRCLRRGAGCASGLPAVSNVLSRLLAGGRGAGWIRGGASDPSTWCWRTRSPTRPLSAPRRSRASSGSRGWPTSRIRGRWTRCGWRRLRSITGLDLARACAAGCAPRPLIMNCDEAAARMRAALPAARVSTIPPATSPRTSPSCCPRATTALPDRAHGHAAHASRARPPRQRGSAAAPGAATSLDVDILPRSHVYLLEAVDRLRASAPGRRIEVHLAGGLDDADRAVIGRRHTCTRAVT